MRIIHTENATVNIDKCTYYERSQLPKKAWEYLSQATTKVDIFYSLKGKNKGSFIIFVSENLIIEI